MTTINWLNAFKNSVCQPLDLELKADLHRYVLEQMEDDGVLFGLASDSRENLMLPVITYIQQYLMKEHINQSTPLDTLAAELVDEMLGYGPIENLLKDPSINDILINGPKLVFVERDGLLEQVDHHFLNDEHVIRVIRKMLSPLGRRIDESNPMVDARLPDGSRINAIIPPLALDGPCLSVRKFKQDSLTEQYLLANDTLSPDMMAFLKRCVASRLNILISGATGSGKTTLLNILSQYISPHERVVTIEDAAELQLRNTHVVRLETRPPNSEGSGEVTARELVKNALRMRPDRIILGESRGGEVLDMLQAMNTGHLGSMSTLHANSPRDALLRLEMMVTLTGFNSSENFIRKVVSSAVDMVIQISRLPNGKRIVSEVVEVGAVEDGHIKTHKLYEYTQRTFKTSGIPTNELQMKLEEQLW
ncbi:CpaF family protein [Vibrio sp. CDRSL-10 TSBA]